MGETEIAKLLIKIGLDADDAEKAAKELNDQLGETEKQAEKTGLSMKDLAKGVAAVATAVTAAATGVFAFVNKVTAGGDEIAKTAKKIGVGVEELQRLRFAADRSGASAETLTMALRQQALLMDQASRGGATEFRAALEGIGLTLEDIQGLSAEERFGVLADAINGLQNPAERTAKSMALFGARSGAELVPLLAEGTTGIRALGDEAERLNLVMSEDQAKASEAFQDSWTDIKAILSGVMNQVGTGLIPIVQGLLDRLRDWVKANGDLIRSGLETFLSGVVTAFEALLSVITFVIDNFGTLVSLFAATQTLKAFSAIQAGFAAIGVNASAALGPIGLVTTALLALIPIALKAGDAIGDALATRAGYGNGPTVDERGAPEKLGDLNLDEASRRQLAAQNKAISDESRKLTQLQESGASRSVIRKQQRLVEGLQRGLGTLQSRAQGISDTRNEAQGGLQEREAAQRAALEQEAAQAEAAAQAEFEAQEVRRRGRGGGRAPKKEDKPTSDVLLSDLGLDGVDLEALDARTPAANSIEPTIALTINNFNMDVKIDQSITSNGSALDVANESNRGFARALSAEVAKAVDQVRTPVAV